MPPYSKARQRLTTLLHILAHAVPFAYLAWLVWVIFTGGFGADPVQGMTHYLGMGTLRLLLLTLTVTPLARYAKMPGLIKVRRPLGLWCFTYACLHFSVWITLDLQFMWGLIGEEIVKRTYLLVGFSAWVILLLLAVTSFKKLQRRMGSAWKKLHHWIYLCILLGCLHFIWAKKSGLIEPGIYFALAFFLLAFRYKILLKPFRKQQ